MQASQLPDAALVARIAEHHANERQALPYILPLLAKVAGAHRRRNAKLSALCDAGQELAETLEAHLDEAERELFPAILSGSPRSDLVRRQLDRMYRHHSDLSLLLMRVRWLADDYASPSWGDRSYEALMEELKALEDSVMEHMHLENYLLTPRLSQYQKAA